MKLRTLIILLIIAVLAWSIGLGIALSGCASAPTRVHLDVPVSLEAPTFLLTGPARGHWAEQDEHSVVVYKVRGKDCKQMSAAGVPEIDFHGSFELRKDESLCVLPLRTNQRLLLHGERP